MARSAALNPSSSPFLPGGGGPDPMRSFARRASSFDIPDAGGHPSQRASPSFDLDRPRSRHTPALPPMSMSMNSAEEPSPPLRQVFADHSYPAVESRPLREMSMSGSIESLSDDTHHSNPFFDNNHYSPGPAPNPRTMRATSLAGDAIFGNGPFSTRRGLVPAPPVLNMESGAPHFSNQVIPESPEEQWSTPAPSLHRNQHSNDSLRGAEPVFQPGGMPMYGSRAHNQLTGGSPGPSRNNMGSRASSFAQTSAPFTSVSPVSSVDSAEPAGFDAQLRASPFIHDILSRLMRCEYTSREIQREVGDVHRKLDMLLERSFPSAPPAGPPTTSAPPEFRDPFSPVSAGGNGGGGGGGGPMGRRPSLANIAPNQQTPGSSDDMNAITQRLNTLTTSVGQLLALQTQGLTPAGSGFTGVINMASTPGGMGGPGNGFDVPPNTAVTPTTAGGLPRNMVAGRMTPGMPIQTRAFSVGNIDAQQRQPGDGMGGGPMGGAGGAPALPSLRDRGRRSVMGLMRGGSALSITPVPEEPHTRGSVSAPPGRGSEGPVLTKWEQLSLAPELLHSLNKFGVGPPNKIQQRALPFLLRGADIIAQAPPTQERIAAYVIPAIQAVLSTLSTRPPPLGPIVLIVSTTVDQATQAQRMIRDLGSSIGIRSGLVVGSASADPSHELSVLRQSGIPHVLCGTPQKLHGLFTSANGLPGGDVRFLVLDEVDQLMARNLHHFVLDIVKLLPATRSRGSPTAGNTTPALGPGDAPPIERQSALFSNTVPQDVLNLANTIQLREPVRVLVRRDGNVTHEGGPAPNANRGIRQFYLYLAFTAGGRGGADGLSGGAGAGIIGAGRGSISAETAQAKEWKLDALIDLLEDADMNQVIVHVGGIQTLEAVAYKLASRGFEIVTLHGDMSPNSRSVAVNKFRSITGGPMRLPKAKVLVIYDVQVKTTEISQIPLVVNYDLPKAVEEYSHRIAPAAANHYSRAGVVINFVTATGGDVEMLRSIECFHKIKCPEVPMSIRDIF